MKIRSGDGEWKLEGGGGGGGRLGLIYLFLLVIWKGNSMEMCNTISCKNMRSFMRGMYY